jgi:nitroreductase
MRFLCTDRKNEQPWLFGIIKERETLKKIADLTDHGNLLPMHVSASLYLQYEPVPTISKTALQRQLS